MHWLDPDPATKTERRKMGAAGVVERSLHGPKGEVRGALLQDGTIVRFPPREAAAMAGLLSPGAYLVALGETPSKGGKGAPAA
jgi:hypothetical protein